MRRVDEKIFYCRCLPESLKDCQAMLTKVKEYLDADDSNLLNKVVISLNWDFNAEITRIANDQWSAVYAETFSDEIEQFGVRIECDHVEDGIAGAWLAFANKFGYEKC